MLITRVSKVSGNENTMDLDITTDQLNAWRSGTPIQQVMPHLTPDQREFLITGITPNEWEKIFG